MPIDLRLRRSIVAFPLLGTLSASLPPAAVQAPPAARPDHVIVAPLLGRSGAHLTVRDAASQIRLSLATLPGLLYRISTPAGSGLAPVGTVRDGHADIRFRPTGGDGPDDVRVVLNRNVRWDLRLPAGAGEESLDLTAGRVTRVEAGNSGLVEARLPAPAGTVPVTLSGSVGSAIVSVPAAPLRIGLDRGAGAVVVPWTVAAAVPAGSILTEAGWTAAPNRYAIRFRGSLGNLTVRRDQSSNGRRRPDPGLPGTA